MNQKHRDTIDLYCQDIVPRINAIKLWPKLLENKVFNRDDVNIPRWEENLMDKATIRDIYLTIKTRGPLAFDRFLTSLKQSDHENLANILEGKITLRSEDIERNVNQGDDVNVNDVDDTNLTSTIEWVQDGFYNNMQLSEVPLRIQVQRATKFLDGPVYENVHRYPMRSKPRGLVLIITNIRFEHPDYEPRCSAAHDRMNLEELFEQMGFQVISHCNLTGEGLLEKIKQFSQLKELRKVDSCFIIISSHGNVNTEYEVTEIHGVDYNPDSKKHNYKTVLCTDILNNFTVEACPHLAEKPKIFIFQLCRGDKKQKLVKKPRHTTDTCNIRPSDEMMNLKINGKGTMRNNADMLIVHATLPGHVAFRDKITGSWFIQILCEVFMNHAHKTHLEDLLHMVDERLRIQRTTKEECQTLMVTSIGFNKHCYLNPGLFEDT
ncbi:death regulator Nedd2-like caspase [Megachile rotundata]|uniref:death regulator Nedd2-like caspase n=1 Tax=Megachile rotundata TaxID=143995 RepID=UPI000258E71E|nr:PREDICTED: caspase Nc [Megachile rotundata]